MTRYQLILETLSHAHKPQTARQLLASEPRLSSVQNIASSIRVQGKRKIQIIEGEPRRYWIGMTEEV